MTADATELELLRSSVRGVIDNGAGVAELAEMGLLGLLVPEAAGGSGWCPVEAAAVAEEIGRATGGQGPEHGAAPVAGTPWMEASLAAMALAGGSDPVRSAWLDPLLAGSHAVVFADSVLERTGQGLSGTVTGVTGHPEATVVLIDGRPVLVPRSDDGVEIVADPASIDLVLPAERWMLVDAAPVALDASEPWPAAVSDVRRVLAAAGLVGLLSSALERLVPYLSERVAFGSRVAGFQAIQHRIVDLFLLEFRSRVSVEAAAGALARGADDAARLAAVAHGFVAAQVPDALDECIQLTGGIGFTWEYPLHHELRRAVALAATCGGAAESRRRFALQGAGHG